MQDIKMTQKRMLKVNRKAVNIGEVWNLACCRSNKTSRVCVVESYCKESSDSDTNWLRYLFNHV